MAEDTRAGVARQLLHGRALKGDGRKLHGKGFVDGDVEADGHGRENGNGNGNGNHNRTDVKDKRLRGLLGEFGLAFVHLPLGFSLGECL